jgi:flagellar M-ring protein FliF
MADQLVPFLNQFGGQRRVSMVAVAAGALVVILAFARWAAAPAWVPLSTSVSLAEMDGWNATLEESGIEYRWSNGGSVVEVREEDYAEARVAVAGADLVMTGGSSGNWGIFDETGFGGTEFEERVRFRRALEGELSRTISAMRGMSDADVRIALEETGYLRSPERPATASVKLRPLSGMAPEPAVVEGIARLVANAVPGLAVDNVSVHDDAGRELTAGDEASGLTAQQFALRESFERSLVAKAEELLTRMYGQGNALVQVSADLNFDQIESVTAAYDPDSQVALREDREEIIPEDPSQGASSVTSNTVYGTSETRETLLRGGARVERLSVAVALADEVETNEDGTTTVTPRTPEEVAAAEALVRSAVGLRDDRGDLITVTSAPFEPVPVAPVVETGPDIVGLIGMFSRPVVALIGVLTALLLAFRLMGNLKETARLEAAALAKGAGGAAVPAAAGAGGQPAALTAGDGEALASLEEEPQPRVISAPTPPPVIEIQDPAMTARVLKTWMKEA